MKALRGFSSGVGPSLSLGLALVLLALVLVSSGCLLWFVNQAALNERLAARQKRIESYRGHLGLAQQRLDACWRQTAADLDAQAQTLPPGSLFASQVRAGLADAVICFDAAGRVAYPGPNLPIAELAPRPVGRGPALLPAMAAARFHLLLPMPAPSATDDGPRRSSTGSGRRRPWARSSRAWTGRTRRAGARSHAPGPGPPLGASGQDRGRAGGAQGAARRGAVCASHRRPGKAPGA